MISLNVLFTNFRKNVLFVIFTNFVNPALFSLFRHFLRFNPPARSSDPTDFESAQCPACSHVYTAPSFAHSDALAVPEYSEDQSHSPASGSQRNALANGYSPVCECPPQPALFQTLSALNVPSGGGLPLPRKQPVCWLLHPYILLDHRKSRFG